MTSRIINAAITGVAVIGLTAGPLSMAAASADTRPVVGACREITSTALMQDSGDPLNLTVKKTKGNPFDDVNEGQLPLGPVGGIEFKLYSVRGLELTTNAGLASAQKLTLEQARKNGIDLVASQRTDAEGVTTFTGLKPALYLVEEIAPADTAHDYRTSDPFLVLLPTINADCQTRNGDTVTVVKSRVKPSTPPTVPSPPDTPGTPGNPTTTPPASPPQTAPPTDGSPVPPDDTGTPPTGSGSPRVPLASTGANVLWALIAAGALIAGGVLLVRNRRDEESA